VSAAVDIKAEYSQILEGDLKTINEFFKLKLEELRSRLEQLKRVTKRGEVRNMLVTLHITTQLVHCTHCCVAVADAVAGDGDGDGDMVMVMVPGNGHATVCPSIRC